MKEKAEVLEALRQAGEELDQAIQAHGEARVAYEEAADRLKDAQHRAIREGLQGKNAEAREAELSEKCALEEALLRERRTRLRLAEVELERAKTRLRVLEAITRLLAEER